MSYYEKVRQAKAVTVGTKQTRKAIERGEALEVFVATDAEPHVTEKIIALCKLKGIPVRYVDSMRALGEACGIDVGAAAVAITKER
ncbi:50S ribosomal protein L7ae-like protein [Calditerricola satsumensis]|uniref:Ribosome-associated protein L7Ae-like n=1 Tax=Calditerricola satsumensis TaxID=373054 RepID=A0A8J3BF45_9BACI|nr:50S ribosomal protein L7ae-like protein [Calditerricola satsumensis]GGK06110.1 ribosome-associated protein L7Ae-like [Calditerricola satsumensis]